MGEKVHKFRVVVWGEAPDTPEERKLLRKIDFFILTYCCIAFFFNYLDRAVLANAYVSGMKEDISLTGNQYNLLVTCLSVGSCHSFSNLAAVRFFQGMAEASTYSGTQYIIGSWYKGNEAGKRIGLFQASGMVGTMFSGVLMTAIWSTMDGKSGLPGWRWSFIVDGIVTVPVAIFGFVFFPDLPESTKAFYLNARERELVVSRLPPKDPNGHKIGFSLVKRVLFTLNFWIFTIFWVLGGALEAFTTQTCMVLWMKASKLFTVPQNNTYPLGITAIGIVLTLFTSVTIDATGVHAPYGFFACGVQMITCIILLCWDSVGVGAKLGAFYLAGTAYMIQPIVFVWANKILSYDGDDAARAIILYSMNGASSVLFAFWGIVLYPTTDAATGFRKGTIAMVVVTICLAMWICIVWWQDKRAHSIQLTQGISGTKSIEEVEINTKRKADEEM
ncbi:Major facilitator superfamily domain, general substrate transporter [Penicillium occitanis (nom. inval.)]|nr:Major facilitator superfamily domain, general substrate transporter [Penicillium occitanis (nom. inval.)]PCG95626.1 hypothetical protein PENOC_076830 [Penicillium occitanis (nom. inval.)]